MDNFFFANPADYFDLKLSVTCDIEIVGPFVFSLNNISLCGVIHSLHSRCYLCDEAPECLSQNTYLQTCISNCLLALGVFYFGTFSFLMALAS